MAKPTDLFRWATGANAITAPGEAKKTSGYVFAERPPPKVFNYLFNGAYQWHAYLNNLHNEPDFLGQAFVWTGQHRFLAPIHAPYIGLHSSGELEYTTSGGTYAPRPREKVFEFRGYGSAGAGDAHTSASRKDGGVMVYRDPVNAQPFAVPYWIEPIVLPTYSVLTQWKVIARNDIENRGINIQAQLFKRTPNFTTAVVGADVQIGATQTAAGNNTLQFLGQAGLSETIQADTTYFLVFTPAGSGGGSTVEKHVLYTYKLFWDDPGPRNY